MRVPVLTPQTSEASAPNVSIQPSMTPSQAVGMVRNQTDGLTDLIELGVDQYNKFQDQNNRVRVIDAQNKEAELRLRLQTDEANGYRHRTGVDVVGYDQGDGVGFVDAYSQQYQDGVSEIAKTLGNDQQRAMFAEYTQKSGLNFQSDLQSYYLNENDTYQQSVFSSATDRYGMIITENPANFETIDEARLNMQASINELINLQGKSATEAENIYMKSITKLHGANVQSFIESGNLQNAMTYMDRYKGEMSLQDEFKYSNEIKQKIENIQIEQVVNQATIGTQENSNPAFNAPPAVNAKLVQSLRDAPPDELKNIKYDDPRLDAYTVTKGAELGMEWASPLLLGIRLAGERSHNWQVSPKGAKSVMQFMPDTWHGKKGQKNGYKWDRETGRERDLNNPTDVIDAAFDFLEDLAKEYKTRDPMVLAAHYNGGYDDGRAVASGKPAVEAETRAYLQRMGQWLEQGFGQYAKQPTKTREQARDEIWNNPNLTAEGKTKAQSQTDRYYKNQDEAKKAQQDQVYDATYKGIIAGQYTFEQIPTSRIDVLEPKQIASLKAASKQTYGGDSIKTDSATYSLILLNQEELFKGKPQSVLHQYADKLSPSDYKSVTKMYMDVNKPEKAEKVAKDKTYIIDDATTTKALKPYLNLIGITNTKDKNQLLHYNAVKIDLIETLRQAEKASGGHLTMDQINRVTLRNINRMSKTKYTGFLRSDSFESDRTYSSVKSKDEIPSKNMERLRQAYQDQGRNPDKVSDAEYVAGYYAQIRRGY